MVERLFFALFPDPITTELIARRTRATWRRYHLDPSPVAPARFHISLHCVTESVGAIPASDITSACAAADSLMLPDFTVTLDHALSFKGRVDHHPYVLTSVENADGLHTLHQNLQRVCGERVHRFKPHLTLFYSRETIPEHPVFPVSWLAREFALVRSFVGRGHYECLGRWRLHGS